GDEQVALVLAVIVIGDDHNLSRGEGCYHRLDAMIVLEHLGSLHSGADERPWRRFAQLPALTQIVIGEHACHHGLADRHRANSDAGVGEGAPTTLALVSADT